MGMSVWVLTGVDGRIRFIFENIDVARKNVYVLYPDCEVFGSEDDGFKICLAEKRHLKKEGNLFKVHVIS